MKKSIFILSLFLSVLFLNACSSISKNSLRNPASDLSPLDALTEINRVMWSGATSFTGEPSHLRMNYVGTSDEGDFCEVVFEKENINYIFYTHAGNVVGAISLIEKNTALVNSRILDSVQHFLKILLPQGTFRLWISQDRANRIVRGSSFTYPNVGTCRFLKSVKNSSPHKYLFAEEM